jgi:hypothetical protein
MLYFAFYVQYTNNLVEVGLWAFGQQLSFPDAPRFLGQSQ